MLQNKSRVSTFESVSHSTGLNQIRGREEGGTLEIYCNQPPGDLLWSSQGKDQVSRGEFQSKSGVCVCVGWSSWDHQLRPDVH